MGESLFSCRGISMDFGITKALNKVDFDVKRGTVCGLIGENGSGKSTLASIIAGIYHPTAGEMYFNGAKWAPKDSLFASQKGVGIIVQEMGTSSMVTVAQNIFLGQEKRFAKFGFVNKAEMNRSAKKVLDEIGVKNIDASAMTMRLDMQERKLIEIAKAYNNNPDIFIVDETTNVLSQDGREILFKLIHRLANEGKSVIIISHDIDEVMEHCDNITILMDGKVTATLEKQEFDKEKIKQLMVGRELEGNFYRIDNDDYSNEVVLKTEGVTALRNLTNVSIELHKGEILGIGGLSDSGMHVLGKTLFGAERLAKGKVLLDNGVEVKSPEIAVKNGIAYISKDRDKESLALDASIYTNIASSGIDENRIFNFFNSPKKEKKYVMEQKESLKIKCTSVDQLVRSLSGGNKQKVAFGKWFAKQSDIFIMDCPTRGIDIGVKQEIYRMMYQLKKQGKSIIMISEEMAELIGMCDRILIMNNGRVAKEFFRKDGITERQVIEYMI